MTTDSAVLLNWDVVAMPPKRQPSVTDLTVEELRRLIREEVQTSMRDELSDLSSRLDNIEHQVTSLNEFKATISAVEKAISHTSQRMDDLHHQVSGYLRYRVWRVKKRKTKTTPGLHALIWRLNT